MASLIQLGSVALGVALLLGAPTDASGRFARKLPEPLPGHPGNLFLAGEEVVVPLPPGAAGDWQAADFEGRPVAHGLAESGPADLGRLSVGYYEVRWRSADSARTNRVSAGVLARPRSATPATSPIGLDVAMAWFYPEEKMPAAANLCALAGVNWVRDRLSWAEMEPDRGRFAATNRYDASARIQSAAGLRVLQVNHSSPAWANPQTKRFPLDLRDAYNFYRTMARRWRGQVAAFEPWNEADIEMFGGHTGDEMAALQKAAYLGLKAGNPDVIACLNVFAVHRASTLRDFAENEAWPYFDTFNLHHYEPFASYPKLYADFRAVSAGRPLWVTESSVPVQWSGDRSLKEPTDADLALQAERVAKTYASAIHEGARAVFYFLLPHYAEGQTQFGILRPDLTPRPAFVALAAVGRLLADARPLGRLETEVPSLHGFLFRAKPEGVSRRVLVIWADQGEREFALPEKPVAVFDHLGREIRPSGTALRAGPAPRFVLLGKSARLALAPPPVTPRWRPGQPSPVVLQAVVPPPQVVLGESAYRVKTGKTAEIPVCAYNFGSRTFRGRLRVEATPAAAVEFPSVLELAPGERRELTLRLRITAPPPAGEERIRIRGDFGAGGEAMLSLRLTFHSGE